MKIMAIPPPWISIGWEGESGTGNGIPVIVRWWEDWGWLLWITEKEAQEHQRIVLITSLSLPGITSTLCECWIFYIPIPNVLWVLELLSCDKGRLPGLGSYPLPPTPWWWRHGPPPTIPHTRLCERQAHRTLIVDPPGLGAECWFILSTLM